MTLFEQKWKILSRRMWLFRYIPFIDFVLVAGSMAMGNPKENSDFDVIVGVKYGRIFTVRFLCWLLFGALGLYARHNGANHPRRYKNKLCFNHFVTEESYKLSGPYNAYWQKLYQSLIPMYGSPVAIRSFQDANAAWAGAPKSGIYNPKDKYRKNFIKLFLEKAFIGHLGYFIETKLKALQVKSIEKSIKRKLNPKSRFFMGGSEYKPRIRYGDDELEFHPDTKRIENYTSMNMSSL